MGQCSICEKDIEDNDKKSDWSHQSCWDRCHLNLRVKALSNSVYSWDLDALEEKIELVRAAEEQYAKDLEEYGDIAEKIASEISESIVIPEINPQFDAQAWKDSADVNEEFFDRLSECQRWKELQEESWNESVLIQIESEHMYRKAELDKR